MYNNNAKCVTIIMFFIETMKIKKRENAQTERKKCMATESECERKIKWIKLSTDQWQKVFCRKRKIVKCWNNKITHRTQCTSTHTLKLILTVIHTLKLVEWVSGSVYQVGGWKWNAIFELTWSMHFLGEYVFQFGKYLSSFLPFLFYYYNNNNNHNHNVYYCFFIQHIFKGANNTSSNSKTNIAFDGGHVAFKTVNSLCACCCVHKNQNYSYVVETIHCVTS